MATVDLDSTALDELNSVETTALFDTVDKLSSLGVGRIVDLPQIIVVGDQSSGKSSVLKAISNVHFPAAEGVCTRFATELVLRPGSRRSVTATVRFADGNKPPQPLQVANFSQDDMDGIIRDAKEKMGISDDGRSFSKDVLRLDVEWPNMYPLTLVDLPGIFHAETAKQSAEGRSTVMALLDSYMKNPNSIILAIVSAKNDLANQAVMQQAVKHDPTKTRTLGVLTKPDLLRPKSSDEYDYLQVVCGRERVHKLGLGWHVLRNLADYEQDLGPRDAVEAKFLASEPWMSLPQSNRGVGALRVKLGRILHEHIKKGLPAVLEDIQVELSRRQAEKSRLGPARSSTDDMRTYLIEIAGEFQRLVRDDIRGQYNDPFHSALASKGQQHLRSQLRNFNRGLRQVLLDRGATMDVRDDCAHHGRQQASLSPSGYLGDFLQTCGYLDGLPQPQYTSSSDLSAWLERHAAANQGMEFPGSANTRIMVTFFQTQIRPWKSIAERHIEKVVDASKVFVEAVLEHVVGPFSSNSTTRAIVSTYVDDFFDERKKVLGAKVTELLRPYEAGYALPLDYDFHEETARRAAEEMADRRESTASSEQDEVDLVSPLEHGEFGTQDVINTVDIFYDMALRTFTENVINLAVEGCLIQELPNIFTPRTVTGLDEAVVKELAAESEEVRHSRSQLEKDIKLLEQGMKQCRPYRTRTTLTVPPSAHDPTPQQRTSTLEVGSGDDGQSATAAVAAAAAPATQASATSNSNSSGSNLFGATLPDPDGKRPVFVLAAPSNQRTQTPDARATQSGGIFSFSSNPSPSPDTLASAATGSVSRDSSAPATTRNFGPPSSPFSFVSTTPSKTKRGKQPSGTQGQEAPSCAHVINGGHGSRRLPNSVHHVFQPRDEIQVDGDRNHYQNLCFSDAFREYSPEEIRLGDYYVTQF